MLVNAVTGPPGDLTDDQSKAGIVDLVGPAAARADNMVVVRRLTDDVGMLAGWQVQPLDGARFREDLERPEDRRPADPEALRPGASDELGGREMTLLICDQEGKRSARLRQAVAGAIERADDRGRVSHRAEPIRNETESQHAGILAAHPKGPDHSGRSALT